MKTKGKEFYPGSHLQRLFDFFINEHNLVLTEGQMNDIIREVSMLQDQQECDHHIETFRTDSYCKKCGENF